MESDLIQINCTVHTIFGRRFFVCTCMCRNISFYKAQIWYTGVKSKLILERMQRARNVQQCFFICKRGELTYVFERTYLAPLHRKKHREARIM